MTKVRCDYCQRAADRVYGDRIYPHRRDLHRLRFYYCNECEAYVGTHQGTWKPLGRLAKASLRKAKSRAHLHFDMLWRRGPFSRTEAYEWLAKVLGIPLAKCHIGMFDEATCERVVRVSMQFNSRYRRGG